MASEKQIQANRRNAQLSTGPTTPEGKAISSQNAFQHGLRSGKVLFAVPDDSLLEAARDALIAEYQPRTATEWILIERMAVATLKLNCFEELEQDWESRMNEHKFTPALQIIWRHQAALERTFDRALNNLLKLRKARAAQIKAAETAERKTAARSESAATPAPPPEPAPAPLPAPAAERPASPESPGLIMRDGHAPPQPLAPTA